MEQLSLLDIETPLLNEEFTDKAPLLWIKELRFITEASPKADEKCRIELRKGLNIVWAKPLTDEIARDKEASVAGHAAGKTTLCRMLRFALGERHFANEVVTQSIRDKFSKGCVCAEIMIDGEQWSICRPVSRGYHPKCMKDGSIDQLLESEGVSYDVFTERLEDLTQFILAAPKLPNDVELGFQHILPWLSRDQEAGYRELTEWRDKSSNADSPFQRQDDRYFCMRSLLSLITGEEIDLVRERDEKNKELEQSRISSNTLKERQDAERKRIKNEAKDHIDLALLDLSLDEIKKHLVIARDGIVIADSESPLIKQAEKEHLEASQELAIAQRDLEMLQEVCNEHHLKYRTQLASDNKDAKLMDTVKSMARKHPGRTYCCQPMELAREEGCPLCREDPEDLTSERMLRKEESKIEKLKRLYELAKANVDAQKLIVKDILDKVERLAKHYADLKQKHSDKINKNAGKYAACDRLIRDLTDYKTSAEKLQSTDKKRETLESAIETLSNRVAAYRDQAKRKLGDFSASYDRMLREILGTAVSGNVKLHGTSFRAKAEYNGELTSAAIESLKTIIFDLTAILFALNDNAQHPCFLIHDGPRAADLDAWLYKKIFVLMYNLEQQSNSSFQYIITTTEPPPSDLQKKPWLVHELDASKPDGRLLGVNL